MARQRVEQQRASVLRPVALTVLMRRLACPAVVVFLVLAACADLTSPKGRSLVIPQPWPLRMIDSVHGPTLQLEGTAVSFRVFGACPGDILQTWPQDTTRGIAVALRRPPDAPRRCEALTVAIPIGHPPPSDSVAELSIVIRNADGSEQRHVVRLQYPQDAPWWPLRCRWQGPICVFEPPTATPR